MKTLTPLLSALLLSSSALVHAQEAPAMRPAAEPLAHRHLGFFFRATAGLGFLSGSETAGANSSTTSGFAGELAGSLGYAVQENHILALHAFWAGAPGPSVSNNVNYASGSASLFASSGFGPQYSFYVMPLNLSLSAALLLTRAAISVNSDTQTSNLGVGVRVGVGKEWWVGNHWGLGVIAQLGYASNGQPNGSGGTNTLTSSTFTLAFSATYN